MCKYMCRIIKLEKYSTLIKLSGHIRYVAFWKPNFVYTSLSNIQHETYTTVQVIVIIYNHNITTRYIAWFIRNNICAINHVLRGPIELPKWHIEYKMTIFAIKVILWLHQSRLPANTGLSLGFQLLSGELGSPGRPSRPPCQPRSASVLTGQALDVQGWYPPYLFRNYVWLWREKTAGNRR